MELALELLAERTETARKARLEKSAAELISVRRVFVSAERRKAAISRYLSCNSLTDERTEKLFAVVPVTEKIVMRMRVYKAGANIFAHDINNLIGVRIALTDSHNLIIFNKNIADKRGVRTAVKYRTVFK